DLDLGGSACRRALPGVLLVVREDQPNIIKVFPLFPQSPLDPIGDVVVVVHLLFGAPVVEGLREQRDLESGEERVEYHEHAVVIGLPPPALREVVDGPGDLQGDFFEACFRSHGMSPPFGSDNSCRTRFARSSFQFGSWLYLSLSSSGRPVSSSQFFLSKRG